MKNIFKLWVISKNTIIYGGFYKQFWEMAAEFKYNLNIFHGGERLGEVPPNHF